MLAVQSDEAGKGEAEGKREKEATRLAPEYFAMCKTSGVFPTSPWKKKEGES